MSHRTLLPGYAYRFLYPAINFECLPSKLEERQILVRSVRDTELDPLDAETLVSHPFTKRGRLLVTGLDLEKMEERSFYVYSMVAVMKITAPDKALAWLELSANTVEQFQDFAQLNPPRTSDFDRGDSGTPCLAESEPSASSEKFDPRQADQANHEVASKTRRREDDGEERKEVAPTDRPHDVREIQTLNHQRQE